MPSLPLNISIEFTSRRALRGSTVCKQPLNSIALPSQPRPGQGGEASPNPWMNQERFPHPHPCGRRLDPAAPRPTSASSSRRGLLRAADVMRSGPAAPRLD